MNRTMTPSAPVDIIDMRNRATEEVLDMIIASKQDAISKSGRNVYLCDPQGFQVNSRSPNSRSPNFQKTNK